jgi:hypothetical protein
MYWRTDLLLTSYIYGLSSLKWTRGQLFLKSRLLQQRQGVNLWNGFVRAQLKEANEGMSLSRCVGYINGLTFMQIVKRASASSLQSSLLRIRQSFTVLIPSSPLRRSKFTEDRFSRRVNRSNGLLGPTPRQFDMT